MAGLGWVGKNTLALEPAVGKLVPPGRLAHERNARLRRTHDDRPLRHLPGLHRRLPDRRDRRALSPRRAEVHFLFDDRAPRADSARAAQSRSARGSSAATSARTFAPSIAACRRPPSRPFSRGPIRIRSSWPNCFAWTMRPFASDSAAVPSCGPGGEVCFARPLMHWATGRIASALPALVEGLHDADPAVREACAWALERYDCEEARAALGK